MKKQIFSIVIIMVIITFSAFKKGTPTGLPTITDGLHSWEKLKEMYAQNIFQGPNNMYEFNGGRTDVDEKDGDMFFKELLLSYGVLVSIWYIEDKHIPKKEIWQTLGSEKLRQSLYTFMKPDCSKEFSKLSTYHQDCYIELAEHAQKYLQNFSYTKELQYLKSVRDQNGKKNERDLETGFTYTGPDGQSKFRKLEAFIFRRVHKNGIQVSEMKKWIDVMLKDMKEIRLKTPLEYPSLVKSLPISFFENFTPSPDYEALICEWSFLDWKNLNFNYAEFSTGDSSLNANPYYTEFKHDKRGNCYYLIRANDQLVFGREDLLTNTITVANFENKEIDRGRGKQKIWLVTEKYTKLFNEKIDFEKLKPIIEKNNQIIVSSKN